MRQMGEHTQGGGSGARELGVAAGVRTTSPSTMWRAGSSAAGPPGRPQATLLEPGARPYVGSVRGILELLRPALAERYRIDREIGRGAMAVVFLAEPVPAGRLAAIKALRPELTVVLGAGRFQREVEILGRLSHPGIVPVLESGIAGSLFYLVMPYVAGENLRTCLDRAGPLSVAEVLSIAADLAPAIDHAHGQRIVHRDIKPANVLLDGRRALICDFGLALAIDRAALEPLSSSGLVIGTPAYMSPEQATGQETVGTATDIYALGCMIYEMLTGDLPFPGATPQAMIARRLSEPPRSLRTVRPDVPARLEAAVMAALARAPSDRPASAAAFMAALAG